MKSQSCLHSSDKGVHFQYFQHVQLEEVGFDHQILDWPERLPILTLLLFWRGKIGHICHCCCTGHA